MSEENASHAAASASGNLDESRQHAAKAMEDLQHAAHATVHDIRNNAEGKVREIRGQAEQAYTQARDRAQTLRSESETWIRDNPTRAVLTAMGVGFVLGLMFRK